MSEQDGIGPVRDRARPAPPTGPMRRGAARPSKEDGPGSVRPPHEGGPGPAVLRRRRLVALLLLVVLVLGIVAIVIALGGDDDAPTAPETVTETIPVPTPTSSPLERTEGSELFLGLPASVRDFVLVEIVPAEDLPGTTESYALRYEGADEVIQVLVGQWETPEEAAAAAAAMAPGEASSSDEVVVDGAVTGTVSTFEAVPADGETTIVWTNGTLALRAVGPSEQMQDFYRGYAY